MADPNLFMMCTQLNKEALMTMPGGIYITPLPQRGAFDLESYAV